jgi:signal transduction histidine kinase/ActR/RegA family two-component response regulator
MTIGAEIMDEDVGGHRAKRSVAMLGAVVIAGLWLGTALLAWRDHDEAIRAVDEKQRSDLAVMRAYMHLVVDGVRQIHSQLEIRLHGVGWDEASRDPTLLRSIGDLAAGQRDHIVGISLVDETGMIRLSSLENAPGRDLSDRSYFLALMNGEPGPMTEAVTGRVMGMPVLAVAFALMDPLERPRGMALVTISRDAVDRFFGNVVYGSDARLALTRRNGDFVFDSDSNVTDRIMSDPLYPAMQINGYEGRLVFDDPDRGRLRADFAPVPNTRLLIRVERSLDRVLRGWRIETARNASGALILSAFAAVFVMRNRRAIAALDAEGRRRAESEAALIRKVGEIDAARREVEEARQAAEKANAAKTEFLASISHEIRTPMNGVLGFLEMLRRTDLTPVQKRYVERVTEAGKSLQAIMDEVLDMSKLEAGELRIVDEPFDLGEVVEAVAAWAQVQAEARGVVIGTAIQPGVPRRLNGDAHRLKQILTNLIANALKFTPSGSIVIDIRETVRGPETIELRFRIRDTGIGIAAADIPSLFKAFSQVGEDPMRHREGTGLGLAICRKLVEIQGGRIGVESEVGRGSTFWFDIAFRREHSEAAASSAAPIERAFHDRTAKVLVVDDIDMNRELVRLMLENAGFEVDEAETGLRALQRAAQRSYDVVLMDVRLGEEDGLETTRRIRGMGGHWTEAPILGLSASVFPEQVERCIEAGMNDFVPKPIDPETLIAKVAAAAQGSGVAVRIP